MDGNNRWSKKNKCGRYNGYKEGANTLIKLSNYIFDHSDTKFISAFALSKNNLNRSKNLISTLKKILLEFLNKVIEDDIKYNFNIKFIGNRNFLSSEINKKINQLESLKNNNQKSLLIYVNYSGKNDIQQAAFNYHKNYKNTSNFHSFLMTSGIPDPDILIRTGGFNRLSDFLIYQSSFAELFFSKKLWPDLNSSDLSKIFKKYYSIERKFGI
tara:strand:- start:672 stop:1310 length:639 start_codon:yes stop_codon:yes gene_type:complete